MNICIISHGYPTPINPSRYVFVDQLACAWADLGLKVTVINPIPLFVEYFDKERFYKQKWEKETQKGESIVIFSPRYFRASERRIGRINTQKISYYEFQRVTIKTIKQMKTKPDVLYSHFLNAGCHAGDIGNKANIPAFCAFGESSFWSIDSWDLDAVRNSLRKLNGIISVSTENKRKLVENDLFQGKDIGIFPNGVDHDRFFPRNKKIIREKYGFPQDAFIGVFTGSFSDDKGVLRAQKASVSVGNVQMIFIGSGVQTPDGSNILFRGRLEHEKIPEYLCAADFFILPTKAEGCCNAIIEAMSCGLPIISANGAYNDDILSDRYSIRTDPEDIDAMAQAIRYLRDNPIKRDQMAENAKKASISFDINKRASGIIDFILRKMEERNNPGVGI